MPRISASVICCEHAATKHKWSPLLSSLPAGAFELHYGQVSYCNIGSGDRLDFTAIGPDVNFTSRIERLNRELDRQIIRSKDFVDCLDRPMSEIGHFQLRGFSRMQLLFGQPRSISFKRTRRCKLAKNWKHLFET
jgi:hypothetical protein